MGRYTHLLSEYKELLDKENLLVFYKIPEKDIKIEQVTCDTRELSGEPAIFFCKGAHFKKEYLDDALLSGAAAYISEKEYRTDIPRLIVSDVRKAMALVGCFHYNNPSSKLKMIGITGTKGKTTTAYFLKPIFDDLERAEKKKESAIISSIDVYDGVIRKEAHMTTPEPLDVQMHCGNAVSCGIEYLTMEVTSQALKYGRVVGVSYDVGVFLNIGYDHISSVEHPNFEDYFRSKLKLFDQCKVGCVNLDSERSDEVLEYAKARCDVITFGTKKGADVFAKNIKKDGDEIVFDVSAFGHERKYRITIPGLFNVENALAAIAVCEALKIPYKYVYSGLLRARSSGRMEVYSSIDERTICIVDYAHNKMSFEALLSSVKKEYPKRNILLVFGCPGKKAFNRREDLGRLAGKYSSHVIITEEDSGEEPFTDISEQIASFVDAMGCPYDIIEDRGEAIRTAITKYGENSVILITGKGDETRQKRGTEYIDCPSDVEYTKKYLDEYDSKIDIQALLPRLDRYFGQTFVIAGKLDEGEAELLKAHGIKLIFCREDAAFDTAKKEKADRLILPCDRGGIRIDEENSKTVIRSIKKDRLKELIGTGLFKEETERLLKKAEECIDSGVTAVSVIDKSQKNCLLFQLIMPRARGTVITAD